MSACKRVLPMFCLLVVSASLHGAGNGDAPGDWNVTLGTGAAVTPRAPGSRETRLRAIPLVDVEYRNRIFLGGKHVTTGVAGLGVHLVKTETWTWSLSAEVSESRRESRSDNMAGMGNRREGIFAATSLSRQCGPLQVSAFLAQGLRDKAGRVGQVKVSWNGRLGGRWIGGLGVSLAAADAEHLNYSFGVDAEQAIHRLALYQLGDIRLNRQDLGACRLSGGLKQASLNTMLGFAFSRKISAMFMVRTDWLQGEPRSSPLVQRPLQSTCALGMMVKM